MASRSPHPVVEGQAYLRHRGNSWVGLLCARRCLADQCRGSVASEGDGYFVPCPVVLSPADPKPDQAKLGGKCLAADVDVRNLVLELLEHRVFDGPGGDRRRGASVPAASVGTAAEIVAVALAARPTRGRRHGVPAGPTVKQP